MISSIHEAPLHGLDIVVDEHNGVFLGEVIEQHVQFRRQPFHVVRMLEHALAADDLPVLISLTEWDGDDGVWQEPVRRHGRRPGHRWNYDFHGLL